MTTKDRKKEEQADEYSIYKVKAYASYKLVTHVYAYPK